MAVSIVALVITALSIVLSTTMVMIAATWKLGQRIAQVDKRIDDVKIEIANGRNHEREWTSNMVDRKIDRHKDGCRAAQDVITGVRSNPLG